ncbi:hypothetical protein [Streptomyces sp. NPDC049881]|uniref:hypothetical protein n=1 Tax=Streptomyces sp. NPDC049881 TaxID=3155778 RepID=UPI003429700F
MSEPTPRTAPVLCAWLTVTTACLLRCSLPVGHGGDHQFTRPGETIPADERHTVPVTDDTLLTDVERYLAALHRHAAVHDHLGEAFACEGCALLRRIAAATFPDPDCDCQPARPTGTPPSGHAPDCLSHHPAPGTVPRMRLDDMTSDQLDALYDQLDMLTAGAAARSAIEEAARDALSAAGETGAHLDDWPHLAPAIDRLAAERDELRAELDGRDEEARERWIQRQLDETGIRAMDFRNGATMELKPARDLLAHWVAAARAMLGDAPNYTETIDLGIKMAESPERYTLVVQRHAPGALTPHEARERAEEQRAEVLRIVGDWVAAVNDGDDQDAGDLAWALQQAGHELPDSGSESESEVEQ